MPRLLAEPKMVGREREIDQLMQHLYSASNGNGAAVVISGEAGIGKTRLVNEFLTFAKRKGAMILAGWCLSEANIPYFPFREAFDSHISSISDGKTKSVIMKQLRATGWFDESEKPRKHELHPTPQIERDGTFEAITRALLQLSTKEPVILFLDDLHWADPLSLALVQYLSRKCRNSRLLIIGTYRLEELAHTEGERPHPLQEIMFALNRDDLLTKIKLASLRRCDFSELLQSIFHSSLAEELEKKLFEETEGNPLFVVEMLNMLASEGYLSEKDGRWVLSAEVGKMGTPAKIHEVISRRIGRLNPRQRKLLDIAAVCGQSFTPDTLRSAFPADLAEIWEMLVELEQQHRLIRSTDSEFQFTHHKIREVIYRSLPDELRRIYHLKIAHYFEQALTRQVTEGYMADMALHSIEGGVPEKAFEYLLKLGEKAVNIYANAQAIDYLDKALETAQNTPSLATSENLARVYKIRGRAWLGRGEITKAVDDFNLLLQNAISFGDESVLAESHYWLGEALTKQYNLTESKLNLLRAMEMARKTGNKLVECRSLVSLGWLLIWGLDTLEESRIRLEESSRISGEIGDRVAYARSRSWLALFYNWRGEFNLARECINEALKLLEELGDRFHTLHALMFLGWINCGKGEYNEAILAIQRCLQLAHEWDIVYWDRAPMPLLQLGWIYRDLSNIELALRYDSEALENAKLDAPAKAGAIVAALVDLGMDYLHRNDYENAEKYFKEADPSMHGIATWRIEIRQLLGFAEIALAKGDFRNALKSVEDSLAISEKAGARKHIAKGLKLKAEALAKMGKIEEAIESMGDALKLAQQVGNPPLLWQIHYSFGLLEEERGSARKAREHYTKAIVLIEAVASQLNDVVLKSTLLTSQEARAMRDAIDRLTPGLAESGTGLSGFRSVNVMASISAPKEFIPSEDFEVKLDLANVGKRPGLLIRIDNFVPPGCEVVSVPSYCRFDGSSLDMGGRRLEPLSVESIKIQVRVADVTGVRLSPKVVYVDECGDIRTLKVEEARILPIVEFDSPAAQAVFIYLVNAFVEDRGMQRLGVGTSGWRSFPQIIKGAEVSKSALYGPSGRLGYGVAELQRKGLVDTETLCGARGRGGHILRVRVHHEKEVVRRYVTKRVPNLLG